MRLLESTGQSNSRDPEGDMPATPLRVFNGVLEVLSHLLGGELGAGSQ